MRVGSKSCKNFPVHIQMQIYFYLGKCFFQFKTGEKNMFTVTICKKKIIAKMVDVFIFHTPAYIYYDLLYVVTTVPKIY